MFLFSFPEGGKLFDLIKVLPRKRGKLEAQVRVKFGTVRNKRVASQVGFLYRGGRKQLLVKIRQSIRPTIFVSVPGSVPYIKDNELISVTKCAQFDV